MEDNANQVSDRAQELEAKYTAFGFNRVHLFYLSIQFQPPWFFNIHPGSFYFDEQISVALIMYR